MINKEDYTLQGSNDEKTWTDLLVSDMSTFAEGMLKPPYFQYYRLISNITKEIIAKLFIPNVKNAQKRH